MGTSAFFCFFIQNETQHLDALSLQPSNENDTIDSSDAQAFRHGQELHHWPSWVGTFPTHPPDLVSYQPPLSHEPFPFNKSHYVYVLLVLCLWRTLANTPCFILSFGILIIYSVLLTIFLTLENQVLSSLCCGKKTIFRKGKICFDQNTLRNL